MHKLFRSFIVLALIIALLCPTALAASYGATVLTSSMTVYTSAKRPAGVLKQGASITVTAISGNWARISYRGRTGYAALQNIKFNNGIAAVARVNTSISFVTRESYSQNKYYSATLSAGTPVYVVGKKGSDALVSNASGSALGYVKFSALTRR